MYVPNSTRYLQLSTAGNSELRFRIKLKYDMVQTVAGSARMPAGISIVASPEYRWF